ncbi:MAG: AraC family transcriptional regulator ligand-binding domain-containing protein, partial [Myxococcales bacterium]|nr:AraC family transcriptional regulator ligand-binding domain-containing protein [Myxococcales bacterium]
VLFRSTGLSAALLLPLSGVLTELGVDGSRFLTDLGLSTDATPDTFVAGERVDALLEAAATELEDPVFGLTMARAAAARPLGLFGHMVWLSGTIRDAISRATRLYSVVSRRTLLSLEQHEDSAVLRQATVPGASRGKILTEFTFASFALRAERATRGKFALQSVHFASESASHPAYAALFGAPVSFGARETKVVFAAAMLDLRLEGADPITSTTLEMAAAKLASTAAKDDVLSRVEQAVSERVGSQASLPAVATVLGMSERSLRRALEQRGTSFRAVLDDARMRRADDALANGRSMKEVSLELGFSEPSAFSRAYKRWRTKRGRSQ